MPLLILFNRDHRQSVNDEDRSECTNKRMGAALIFVYIIEEVGPAHVQNTLLS